MLEPKEIYAHPFFNFTEKDVVRISEDNIPVSEDFLKYRLLANANIELCRRHNYRYLHVGCIQVARKPLFGMGLDVQIYIALRDKRHLNFSSLYCPKGLFNKTSKTV